MKIMKEKMQVKFCSKCFTPTQIEHLLAFAEDSSEKTHAKKFGISLRAVKNIRERIRYKTSTDSMTQLFAKILMNLPSDGVVHATCPH
jgi:FixJ family two-component response regulator